MGESLRVGVQRGPLDYSFSGASPNSRPRTVVRHNLDTSVRRGPKQTRPPIRIGDRFGELTVTGFLVGVNGGLLDRGVLAECSCGLPEESYRQGNLYLGRTTRCRVCGVRKAIATRKAYVGYRDVVPNDDVRNSLLQRINGIYRRCHNPEHHDFHNYGGRGLRCWWYDQYGVGAVKKKDKAVWRRKMLEYLVQLEGHDVRGHELDRIDNSRGYEPGNLRFVRRKTNANNRRTIWGMQKRIDELEAEVARLRSCKCWSSQQVYGSN